MIALSQKHYIEPNYVIGLSLQISEHRHSQNFGLVAPQEQNVPTHGHMLIFLFS